MTGEETKPSLKNRRSTYTGCSAVSWKLS